MSNCTNPRTARLGRQTVKAVVDLDGIEALQIVRKHLRCGPALRIKRAYPMLVMPAGRADANLRRHEFRAASLSRDSLVIEVGLVVLASVAEEVQNLSVGFHGEVRRHPDTTWYRHFLELETRAGLHFGQETTN